jgi:hypothetical protein
MSLAPLVVAVTVETDAGPRLRQLAGRVPVWAVDTDANRAHAQALAAAAPTGGAAPEVTLFRADPGALPDEWAAAALAPLVERHRAFAHGPPLAALEFYGVLVTDALRAALAERGFADVVSDGDAVIARP